MEYQPGGRACERGPCAPQISAKRHLRLKRRSFGGEEDSRPGAARELGGEPISRLLPGAALPRPAPGQPGRGPAAGGHAAWCSRCSSHEPGGHGGPGGVARLQSAPAVSLRPVHWTPVSLRTQVTEGGTRPQCSPRVSASRASNQSMRSFSLPLAAERGCCLGMDLEKFAPGRRCIRRLLRETLAPAHPEPT